jgi:hypothetical protein
VSVVAPVLQEITRRVVTLAVAVALAMVVLAQAIQAGWLLQELIAAAAVLAVEAAAVLAERMVM